MIEVRFLGNFLFRILLVILILSSLAVMNVSKLFILKMRFIKIIYFFEDRLAKNLVN